MKVCPKWGYIDRSMWRQNKWRTNVEFLKDEYYEDIDPSILRKLKEGRGIQVDENYAYRLQGKNKNVIECVLIEQYKIDGKNAFIIPRERVDHSIDYSTKITDYDIQRKIKDEV